MAVIKSARGHRKQARRNILEKAGLIPFRTFSTAEELEARLIIACNLIDPERPYKAYDAICARYRRYMAGSKFCHAEGRKQRAQGRRKLYEEADASGFAGSPSPSPSESGCEPRIEDALDPRIGA